MRGLRGAAVGLAAIVCAVCWMSLGSRPGRAQDAAPGTPPEELVNGLDMELKLVPAGEFLMGSPADEKERKLDEGPQHRVRISRPFYIGKFEVTQAQWKALMNTSPWRRASDDAPATFVSWEDAQEFCKKLTEQERAAGRITAEQEYKLPTEAQWEYACRSGSKAAYCFGDDPALLEEYGWYGAFLQVGSAAREPYPHDVGTLQPSEWGLYDMHGNVQEWCLDWYDPEGYARAPAESVDPLEEKSTGKRVLRGGTWFHFDFTCRSADRNGEPPDAKLDDSGFRVVLTAPPAAS